MKTARRRPASRRAPSGELAELRSRVVAAEATLRAIRTGEVDAVIVDGKRGARVFTLEGVGHAYRVLIESMNEGALTITPDKVILYANRCFAGMIRTPLQQVIGGSLRRFLGTADRATLRPLLLRPVAAGSSIQVTLNARNGLRVPARISIRLLPKNGSDHVTFGLVVTDMTETRRNEDLLRGLSNRLVQAQEADRGRVALELHDHITQLLCAVLFRCQALTDELSASDGSSKTQAATLVQMVAQASEEVERISRDLRPGALHELGLLAVLRTASAEFTRRTQVPVKLACLRLAARLPADVELALYRVLQEALRNVEQHARARHVNVSLKRRHDFVRLVIQDDGIGFDPARHPARGKNKLGLGLISMRERASYLGGALVVESTRRGGTRIEVGIPVSPGVTRRGQRVAGVAR